MKRPPAPVFSSLNGETTILIVCSKNGGLSTRPRVTAQGAKASFFHAKFGKNDITASLVMIISARLLKGGYFCATEDSFYSHYSWAERI